jgi:hypothetical protein
MLRRGEWQLQAIKRVTDPGNSFFGKWPNQFDFACVDTCSAEMIYYFRVSPVSIANTEINRKW